MNKQNTASREVPLAIEGMTCSGCAVRLEESLRGTPGVRDAVVNLSLERAAVVIDDDFQGVTRIVRGTDLLDSTPRQLALYRALNLRPPEYLHIPILVDRSGDKLSKQAHAKPIDISDPVRLLRQALIALGQDPQNGTASLTYLLSRAIKAWQVDRIPIEIRLSAPPDYL